MTKIVSECTFKDIGISSDESDKEDSYEENSNKEDSYEENSDKENFDKKNSE